MEMGLKCIENTKTTFANNNITFPLDYSRILKKIMIILESWHVFPVANGRICQILKRYHAKKSSLDYII